MPLKQTATTIPRVAEHIAIVKTLGAGTLFVLMSCASAISTKGKNTIRYVSFKCTKNKCRTTKAEAVPMKNKLVGSLLRHVAL